MEVISENFLFYIIEKFYLLTIVNLGITFDFITLCSLLRPGGSLQNPAKKMKTKSTPGVLLGVLFVLFTPLIPLELPHQNDPIPPVYAGH